MVARSSYNEVFERLVTDTDDIEGFIAYGLYKQAKREWLIDFHEKNQRAPKAAEFAAYNAYWTETSLQALRENAESALSAYADTIVELATPSIESEALKIGRPVWKDLLIGAMSAVTYSALLLVAAYLIQVFGNDFIDAFRGVTTIGQ